MKKIVGIITLFLVCIITTNSVRAYDFEVGGAYYNLVSITDKTCEICGVVDKNINSILIPANITYNTQQVSVIGIADETFSDCINLMSVKLNNTLEYIGLSSFRYCI